MRSFLYPEHDLSIQLTKLKNTLRYLRVRSKLRTWGSSTTSSANACAPVLSSWREGGAGNFRSGVVPERA